VDPLQLSEWIPLELLEADMDDRAARQPIRLLEQAPHHARAHLEHDLFDWDVLVAMQSHSRRTVRSARRVGRWQGMPGPSARPGSG
jgi:hypothetical protein